MVVAVAFTVLAGCPSALALNPSLDLSQYAHTAWTIREGFTKGLITAIAQTPDGYLWLGTAFGLLRFDGVQHVTWQSPSGQPLPSNDIESLLTTRDGSLWIGTANGLGRWKGGVLTDYPRLKGRTILRLLEDHEGTVWVGTHGDDNGGRLCAIQRTLVQCYGEDGRFGNIVSALYEDSQHNLWVSVYDGLWRWKPGRPEFFSMPGEKDGLQNFVEHGDGLAIGTAKGVRHLRGGTLGSSLLPANVRAFRTSRLLRDRDGGLWIGTHGRGLIHIHNDLVDSFTQADGLSDDNVWSLFEDREGCIWVATSDGLDRFHDVSVSSMSVRQGLSSGLVSSVLAARDGTVWMATDLGLNRWRQGQITTVTSSHSTPNGRLTGLKNTALFQDDLGRIWVSKDDLVGYLDHDRFVSYSVQGIMHAFAQPTPATIWVANQKLGLVELAGNKVAQQIPWTTIGHHDFATTLAADRARSGLWVGFQDGGLVYIRDGHVNAAYSAMDGLGEGRVNDLQVDEDGTLWASTASGLSRLKDGRLKTLTSKNGLPCDGVHWAMQDEVHSLWLYMPCGLVRIPTADVNAWAASDHPGDPTRVVHTKVFDSSDGVPLQPYPSRFSPEVAKSPNGMLWFTSFHGVSVVDPRHLPFNSVPPPVHIERITADRQPYDMVSGVTADMRLPPLVRDVEIDYTALSLVAPEKVRFRYKLEGWDRVWQDVGTRRQAFYTNLPPRSYRFHVMASNDSGVWNESGASMDFSIAPAYYQTTWFRTGIIVAVLALLWMAYQVRLRRLAAEFEAGLQERVNERTRIARELHDTLLQSFHGVMFRFQAALNVLPDRPLDAKHRLETAIKHGTQAIREGRDAIQDLRASTKVTNDLEVALSSLGEELAAAQVSDPHAEPAGLDVAIRGTPQALRPIIRDDVYRIAGEALRNAFRHAGARRIEVEIRYDDRQFHLRVRDDGQGIDPAVLDGHRAGHFGLPGMRERAELIGGHFEVWSKAGMGTEVALTIPGVAVYETSRARRHFWSFGARTRANS